MSSTNNVMGLSRFIMTLPQTKISLFTMVFLSFIIGSISFFIDPTPGSFSTDILYGGTAGVLIFGLSSIMSGAITQPWVNSLKGRKMKMKQSMFLALFSMTIILIIYLIGCGLSSFFETNYILNAIVFGCAIVFAVRTLVIWGTSNINFKNSVAISAIQPLLIISMLIVVVFLTTRLDNIGYFSVFGLILKGLIALAILVIAIYSFVLVVESPMRKNLGVGALELLSLFISHITEGSSALEGVFEDIGEPIETVVGIVSFKNSKGIKALFLSPCVHPGPIGSIGGGNMPTTLAESFDNFTMVTHGPSTHDFNPVSAKEIDKVEKTVKDALKDISYSENASKFITVTENNAKIGAQFFGNDLLLLATFAPAGFDDIDFGVGLSLMNLAKTRCNSENVVLVDCHNSFKGEAGRVLPGNKEVFDLMDAIEKIECQSKGKSIRVGCAYDPMDSFTKTDGIGQSGLKVLIVNVENENNAYILLDSNNMVIGYRDTIIEAVKKLGICSVEVMTTDTHSVNTLAGGHNPVGSKKKEEIIESIINCTKNALEDLEPVSVGCKSARIKNLNIWGPTNSTELVSTISSIVAVSRIIAPLVLLSALFFVFIWIFYGAS